MGARLVEGAESGRPTPDNPFTGVSSAQLRGAPAPGSAGRGAPGVRPPSPSLCAPPAGRWGLCSGAQPRPRPRARLFLLHSGAPCSETPSVRPVTVFFAFTAVAPVLGTWEDVGGYKPPPAAGILAAPVRTAPRSPKNPPQLLELPPDSTRVLKKVLLRCWKNLRFRPHLPAPCSGP